MKILIVVITELKYIGSGNNYNKDDDDADVNVDNNCEVNGTKCYAAVWDAKMLINIMMMILQKLIIN